MSGSEYKLNKDMLINIRNIEKSTSKNSKIYVNICFNYSGRDEIINATKVLAKKIKDSTLNIEDVNERSFGECLYNHLVLDLDLLIRTSGEHRISRFMLWNIAYAKFSFTNVLWPDFSKEHLKEINNNFNDMERRYGK